MPPAPSWSHNARMPHDESFLSVLPTDGYADLFLIWMSPADFPYFLYFLCCQYFPCFLPFPVNRSQLSAGHCFLPLALSLLPVKQAGFSPVPVSLQVPKLRWVLAYSQVSASPHPLYFRYLLYLPSHWLPSLRFFDHLYPPATPVSPAPAGACPEFSQHLSRFPYRSLLLQFL